ncbi:MAG: cytochrome c3 family protein [Gammaproteobacteria bacterium]|nr:cytochrome c3 family protein [Gammaproteobacteria bacterium]
MRHRRLWLIVTAAVGGAVALVLSHDAMVVRAERLPVAFDHVDHTTVGCVECHHNFVDDTGDGLCYDCHKRDPVLALRMQADFHDFCRDCHVELARAARESGPLRGCEDCHHALDPIEARRRREDRRAHDAGADPPLDERRRWWPDLSRWLR